MSKTRMYIEPGQIEEFIQLKSRDAVHKLKDVLRLKESDCLCLFDGRGKEYVYHIEELSKKSILLKQEELLRSEPHPTKQVTLAFPLEREERVDFILQKCTELGALRFIPFVCQRSIQRKPSANKLVRWKKIINEATRQSQRLWIPKIEETLDFLDLAKVKSDLKLVGNISGKTISRKFDKKIKDVLIAIGPVGDFSDQEYQEF